jgi:hypothetical protein
MQSEGAAMRQPAHEPIRHGYTFHQLKQLARLAIARDHWRGSDTTDRLDAALYVIAEEVLTAGDRPTPGDLIGRAIRASNRYVADEMRHHGYDPRNVAAGAAGLPGFRRYWQKSGHAPWDERVIERITLAQIWPQLTLAQQQALTALALTGDYQEAAHRLNLSREALAGRLHQARHRVNALWYEHETPPKRRRLDRRVLSTSGTSQARTLLTEEDLEHLRDRRSAGATLRLLATETGYSSGALSRLLNGKRRPVRAVMEPRPSAT